MKPELLPRLDTLITELDKRLSELKKLRQDPQVAGFDFGVGNTVDALRHVITKWETGESKSTQS